jgi:hypothetical protein
MGFAPGAVSSHRASMGKNGEGLVMWQKPGSGVKHFSISTGENLVNDRAPPPSWGSIRLGLRPVMTFL